MLGGLFHNIAGQKRRQPPGSPDYRAVETITTRLLRLKETQRFQYYFLSVLHSNQTAASINTSFIPRVDFNFSSPMNYNFSE